MSRFYLRIRAELAAVRKELPLYLAATDLFANEEFAQELQPNLRAPRMTVSETLLHAGIDAGRFGADEKIVLIRPEAGLRRISLGASGRAS